jgi:hypothetical protein
VALVAAFVFEARDQARGEADGPVLLVLVVVLVHRVGLSGGVGGRTAPGRFGSGRGDIDPLGGGEVGKGGVTISCSR